MPARRLAHDDEVVGAELILVENAVGDIGRGLQLQHHGAALGAAKLELVVTGGVTPGLAALGFLRPAFNVDAFLLQDVEGALEARDARQFEACFQHVLARQPDLQPAGLQAGVDGAHVENDQVAIVLHAEARGEADGDE